MMRPMDVRRSLRKRAATIYHESLHFLSKCHWYELTSADCPDRVEPGVNRPGSHPVEHHIEDLAQKRLCDGRLTSEADISSEDSDALRETRLEFDLHSYRTNAAQNRQAEDVLERQK